MAKQMLIQFPPAVARKNDPRTSHAAADRVNESGTAISHRARIMGALEYQEGLTCPEIAQSSGLEYHQVQRRMLELKNAGQASTIGTRNHQRVWTETPGMIRKEV